MFKNKRIDKANWDGLVQKEGVLEFKRVGKFLKKFKFLNFGDFSEFFGDYKVYSKKETLAIGLSKIEFLKGSEIIGISVNKLEKILYDLYKNKKKKEVVKSLFNFFKV